MNNKLKIVSGVLTAILGIALILIIKGHRTNPSAPAPKLAYDSLKTIKTEPKKIFGFSADSFIVVTSEIKKNEFLANILLAHQIDYATIDQLAKKSKESFDVRKIAAGKPYTLLLEKDSVQKARYFIYQPDPVNYVVYELYDSLGIYEGQKEVEIIEKSASGVIYSSLYETLQTSEISPYLAVRLADIFAWSIDFYRIQKGDWFKVIYEEKRIDGKPIGIGKVMAVEFNHFGKSFLGFHFLQADKEDYFDETANSLRKAFLKSPLKFSRLSSRYTMRRFHPVQKRWKAHLGTDYAAPSGTPIMSTGDGVVTHSSYTRGNGNYVKIKHNSAYSTQYLHMSKRKVNVGQFVKQGDIIGLVGSTGLATGPHVCYRFWKYGKQVDHLREDFPSAEPVLDSNKLAFDKMLQEQKTKLDRIQIKEMLASK